MNLQANLWVIVIFIVSFYTDFSEGDCKFGDYDLEPLDRWAPWEAINDDGNVTFQISLCKTLPPNGPDSIHCHANTAVCRFSKGQNPVAVGNISAVLHGDSNEGRGEIWVLIPGDPCPEMPNENLTAAFNLKCGQTLGSPQYLNYLACVEYFEWWSNLFCPKSDPLPKEVPCSLIHDGDEYDLSPLIKSEGGYLVDSVDDREVYINVCRDITADNDTSTCSKGSGSCRVINDKGTDMGQPNERLKMTTDGRLQLHYTTNATVDGCTDKPSTTIFFVCPKRGGSKDPILISDFNCQYIVEWHTEHACSVSYVSNDTCVLTKEESDIDVNLTQLTKGLASDTPYRVEFTNSQNETYIYFLNVCGGLGIQCPDDTNKDTVAACQKKKGDSNFGRKMGMTDHQTLRYADGKLTLEYMGGDLCNHNHMQRSTIINFYCNKTAVNAGRGQPEFSDEDDCTYMFDWGTKYACLEHPVLGECRVDYMNKRFDLSNLVRRTGGNWEALHEVDQGDSDKSGSYFINICNDILLEGQAVQCHPDSSICYKDGATVKNLGRYTQSPVYDPSSKTIQLNYTNGDFCSNDKHIQSIITFNCKPGDLQTGPVLTRKSDDHCFYEFQWYTAAACILGRKKGSNCKVYDDDAGYNFDMSRLTMPSGSYYQTKDGVYDYFINVCGPLTGTLCDNGAVSNPGICQTKSNGTKDDAFILGQYNGTVLSYYDGMINLTYINGQRYHDANSTPRKAAIAFLCDPQAGVGNPKVLTESNFTYSFVWYTKYACPTEPVECVFTDSKTKNQYDLSTLSRTDGNWEIEDDSNPQDKKMYYINVCGPVNPVNVDTGCNAYAAACRTKYINGKESLDVPNLGEVTSGPTLDGDGKLVLKYIAPKTCNNGTDSYITTIHFECQKGLLNSHPDPPVLLNPCEVSLLWKTEAACPLTKGDVLKDGECKAKDPNSDFVFDFAPLKKKDGFYTVSTANNETTFKLNICGAVPTTVCDLVENKDPSICSISKNGSKTSLATVSTTIDFDIGRMRLLYEGITLPNGQRTQVSITFLCDNDNLMGEPKFVRKEENMYIFDVETSLACPPKVMDCFLKDSQGREYDLEPLGTFEGWLVEDTRESHTDLKYHISVCKPMDNTKTKCPGGLTGACQETSQRTYNLGYIQAHPIIHEDGSITVHYRNGDICHQGKANQARRSTKITLYCSDIMHSPTFEGETETCEYQFNWFTPAACPLLSKTGDNCTVQDPLYNYVFDLSPLSAITQDYAVSTREYTYYLNVCSDLRNKSLCLGDSKSGACQRKLSSGSVEDISIGQANQKLIYDAGELSLHYSGGRNSCLGKYERRTTIKFSCDQSTDGKRGPTFSDELDDCHYVFDWPTMYACPPFKTAGCSVQSDSGALYDLSSLSLKDDNYDYIDTTSKKKFYFNVCRSLVYQQGTTCPYNAAVCMEDVNNKDSRKKFTNLGEVNEHQVKIENNRLMLAYENGDVCKNKTVRQMTHILLYCDKNAVNTHPTGHFMLNACDHHFIWETPAACRVSDQRPFKYNFSCTATAPDTGTLYDLSTLIDTHGTYWTANDSATKNSIQLNVCKPLTKSACGNGNLALGACLTTADGQHIPLGNVSSLVQYDDGILVLNYTGGQSCPNNAQFQRSVLISFVCAPGTGEGNPVFIDDTDDCVYYIHWQTEVVCKETVRCSLDVQDKDKLYTLDLSPLSRLDKHLVVSAGENRSLYYVSVCQPLPPIVNTLCPPGSAVCKVTGDKTESLGKMKGRPYIDQQTKQVTIQYVNGSRCDGSDKNITSKIIFNCLKGKQHGEPKLIFKENCNYIFQWDTNVVCPPESQSPDQQGISCVYSDPVTNVKLNFTKLWKDGGYTVGNYTINPCGIISKSSSTCKTATVCQNNKISYGSASQFRIEKESSNFYTLKYDKGDICQASPDRSAQSLIRFKCDRSAGTGKPVLFDVDESGCYSTFWWDTEIVCPPVDNECILAYRGEVYDLRLLSREKGSWNITDSLGNKYWINICQGIHSSVSNSMCPSESGVCRLSKDGTVDMLGKVTTQKLYMDDDAETIILEYTQGFTACSSGKRRSDNPSAKTHIKFKCGNTVGGPVLLPGDPNSKECLFEFEWKTTIACKIDRQPLLDKNGTITDPRSAETIDLKTLYNDSIITEDQSTFYIHLNGSSSYCPVGATVCMKTGKDSDAVVLGMHSNGVYYMEDNMLEATYMSTTKCDKDNNKNMKSVFTFHCNPDSQKGNPVFLYASQNCDYLFSWETSVVCLTPKLIVPSPKPIKSVVSTSAHDRDSVSVVKGSSKSSAVGTIIGVSVAAIIVCVLLIIFHKPDRRSAFVGRVKCLFTRRNAEYTQLPQASSQLRAEDEILLFDERDPEEGQHSYHDDSDEDLLNT
ncbi:hypothetical protein ACJMK2_027732 [Sinanodonta woodiana]|uniref:MRH domain-containing protein n=1 Tax=Sinanodonta woodiana TaxID=1069815 RepID=A0ABD3X6P4_SINWO